MTPRRRKTKFINRQRHKASCGPIAIANLIKWCGIETSYKRVLDFCIGVRAYHSKAGMWPFQMRYVLKTLKLKFKVHKKFSIKDLDSTIDSGGSCILIYDTSTGGHAIFIEKRNEIGYRVWNRGPGLPPFFSRSEIEKAIKISTRKKGGLYAYTFQGVATKK